MRWITLILLIASCSDKRQDAVVLNDDSVLLVSQQRTEEVIKALPKVDNIIHEEEQRIEHDLKSLQSEVQSLKVTQNTTKVIYVHDTIMIKEKTNFWGRKRITTDTISYIDSTEY